MNDQKIRKLHKSLNYIRYVISCGVRNELEKYEKVHGIELKRNDNGDIEFSESYLLSSELATGIVMLNCLISCIEKELVNSNSKLQGNSKKLHKVFSNRISSDKLHTRAEMLIRLGDPKKYNYNECIKFFTELGNELPGNDETAKFFRDLVSKMMPGKYESTIDVVRDFAENLGKLQTKVCLLNLESTIMNEIRH